MYNKLGQQDFHKHLAILKKKKFRRNLKFRGVLPL